MIILYAACFIALAFLSTRIFIAMIYIIGIGPKGIMVERTRKKSGIEFISDDGEIVFKDYNDKI